MSEPLDRRRFLFQTTAVATLAAGASLSFAPGARPTKNKSPLLVDPNGVKSREVAAKLLEMIAWRYPQISIGRRIVEHLKSAKQPFSKVGRDISRIQILNEERPQPFVTEAYDHA